LDPVFKEMHNVFEAQIVQESLDAVTVNIVRAEGYTENDSRDLEDALCKRLGSKVKINLIFVDQIPRTKAGKFRFVVSKVESMLERVR
jgi:phenylacetate-CoA ligase